jgi:hypothetical protein
MRRGTWLEKVGRGSYALVALFSVSVLESSANAQLLYSFESADLQGWAATGFGGSDVLGVTQDTQGATVGTHSMAIQRGRAIGDSNAFSWDAGRSVTATVLPDVYASFQAAAADHTKYALDFDVTFTTNGWAGVTGFPAFFSIQASVNGSAAGENNFDQVLNATPVGSDTFNLMGVDGMGQPVPLYGTHHFSLPLAGSVAEGSTGLYLVPNSTYYQLNIGSNFTNSLFLPANGSMKYFVDNVHFSRLPELVPETIFSWETPDNPGTPAVNEQFEGWTEGFHPGHTHSITSTGATDGGSALQIHREFTGSNFEWGSRILLVSDTNPDPEVEEIDPVIQARINELTSKIEAADRIAFDVTFDPTAFDGSPTYTRFGMYFQDAAGFYDAEFANFNMLSFTEETTLTMELPLTAFATAAGVFLTDVGFVDNANFFAIGISTNLDGLQVEVSPGVFVDAPIDFQIDNLRLITEVFPLEGDYNADGTVDAADYTIWRKSVGTTVELPNDPTGGTIGESQYATWKANFGVTGGGGAGGQAAVPEPSAAMLIFAASAGILLVVRRHA